MKRYVGIDPSTKTGLTVVDEFGVVLQAKEITSKHKKDPERFVDITEQIMQHVKNFDKVIIEGFAYGAKGRGVSTQYGIGWIIRTALYHADVEYLEVTPSQLKKFATGKGNMSKDNMILPIYKRWGFESDSDNIRDAFVLSQIGRAHDGLGTLTGYQTEVMKGLR